MSEAAGIEDAFDDFVTRATQGQQPYPYQRRLAIEGLPEVLGVPTGTGKTMAAVLGWLFRRRAHPDPSVRVATPRRLVYVLPMRTLVEQTAARAKSWLNNLALADTIDCHVLMAGEPRLANWRLNPEREAIVVGTLDMVISRALNRGYGESRFIWPIDFGLFNADCHYVYDETQLMGPALATSRQLHGLRSKLGTAVGCSSMWMSATLHPAQLGTFDAPDIDEPIYLDAADRACAPLARRLEATKRIEAAHLAEGGKYGRNVAQLAADHHLPGTRTIVIANTVDRAVEIATALERVKPVGVEVVLVHSRFRPEDRTRHMDQVVATIANDQPGRIVVSTQVIEAGLDVSAATMITEAAPWSSIVQRAGRCNRDGAETDATLLWVRPPASAPYDDSDIAATIAMLVDLEGADLTADQLGAHEVPMKQPIYAVLRRRDLLELFDTLPDLSGNDIDIARFVRDTDDLDVSVVWRAGIAPAGPSSDTLMPGRGERCPVPVGALRKWLRTLEDGKAWRWDHRERQWLRCRAGDVRPGGLVLVDATAGGYDSDLGWSPSSRRPVALVDDPEAAADDQATADDPASLDSPGWVTLADHLRDTEREARVLLDALAPLAVNDDVRQAVVTAARLHDVGKAHPVFQAAMDVVAQRTELAKPLGVPVAKSPSRGRLAYGVPNFRHELASALALLGDGRVALGESGEPDLIVYLVAAHHGRVRVGVRSQPGDERPIVGDDSLRILGIGDRNVLPAVVLDGGEMPASTLDLGIFGLGRRHAGPSWAERALAMRDRADLGPFRLAFLEALVRLADWRASARPTLAVGRGNA
ncbi:MAG: CRISPR-associated helicase Cas3' [Ilumatobacteraceae bacterium]